MLDGHEHIAGPLDRTEVHTWKCQILLVIAQSRLLTSSTVEPTSSERFPSKPVSEEDELVVDVMLCLFCVQRIQFMTRKATVTTLASLEDITGNVKVQLVKHFSQGQMWVLPELRDFKGRGDAKQIFSKSQASCHAALHVTYITYDVTGGTSVCSC